MQERGFVPSVVENAINTGTSAPGKTAGTTVFTDAVNNLRVIVDSATGRVFTVIPGD
jgi:filamentous hemagglutinin